MDSESIIKPQLFELEEFLLDSGEKISPLSLTYETYGELNEKKDNAILLFHSLSGDAHVAGRHTEADKKPGWWDSLVGDHKAFDTKKYFIICANVIGGCQGSSGPTSIDPLTKKPYGLNFPLVTIKDMVASQVKLLDYLGIKTLLLTAGGSMGGMLAIQLSVAFPERVKNVLAIATSARVSAQDIAFNEVGRQAIVNDPNWNQGDYYDSKPPRDGLSIARMIGHITYLSDEAMKDKFGRKIRGEGRKGLDFKNPHFEVESYLKYQGTTFTERFDANSFLYITRAIDLFNLADEGEGSLTKAFSKALSRFLIVHFTSDWLFPEHQALDIVNALKDNHLNISYRKVKSSYGHDAFLLEVDELTKLITSFLGGVA